jgi:hypothetical protein
LGWVALIVSPAVYATIAGGPFIFAVNPGPTPIIPGFATQQQITAIQATHKEQRRLYEEGQTVDRALTQQIIKTVEKEILNAHCHRITGYAAITARDLIDHLLNTYGRIQPSQLIENDNKFKTTYDPNEPFETLVAQVEDAIQFAKQCQQPYTDNQVVNNGYTLIKHTSCYQEACRE